MYSLRRMNHAKMGCRRVVYFILFVACVILVVSSLGSRMRIGESSDLKPILGNTLRRHKLNQGSGITTSLASPRSTSRVPNLDSPSSLSFSVPDDSRVKPTPFRHLSESQNNHIQNKKKKEQEDLIRLVVIIVLLLMLVISIIGLCLLCCCKALKSGSGRRNDERPLLSLSLSDASSHSFSYGASSSNKKLGNLSFDDASNHKVDGDNFYKVNSLSDSKGEIPLQVSHGIVIGAPDTVSQKPPVVPSSLKPPPGRAHVGKPQSGEPVLPPPTPPSLSDEPAPAPPPPSPGMQDGPPPPPPPGMKNGPPPPPPPRKGGPPPPPIGLKAPRAPVPGGGRQSAKADADGEGADASRTKLKPFFWDKVQANDESMVWNNLNQGSFQFNEEMIETLFGCAPVEKSKPGGKNPSTSNAPETIQLIEPKKAQNLAILLKALGVTTKEVCDALQEGNELPAGLLQTLLKMAPTPEEELKLRVYNQDLSLLGNAERFLKVVIEIPFAFMRLESLLFMCSFHEEEVVVKESFATLEAACTALRKNRLFLKLLEAVLKTGNRMNDGTFRGGAQAFKLDTLLKLSDVKGKDGKTTLLHFVVQEIIRTEGARAFRATRESMSFNSIKSEDLLEDASEDSENDHRELGLEVVSRIGNDLESVKKASVLDSDGLTGTVARFGNSLIKARNFLNSEMKSVDEDNGFHQALKGFVQEAEVGILKMLEEEKRIMALVKSTADYFHGNAGKEEGLRIFVIVRDFLVLLDKVCKEIKVVKKKPFNKPAKPDDVVPPRQTPSSDPRQRLATKITEKRADSSGSDEDTW